MPDQFRDLRKKGATMSKDEILAMLNELKGPKYYSCATDEVDNGLKRELFNTDHPDHAYPET